jgi:hypothetical protein
MRSAEDSVPYSGSIDRKPHGGPRISRRIIASRKSVWDIGHAPKDRSNQRKRLLEYAVWEIQPAMALQVVREIAKGLAVFRLAKLGAIL